MSCYNRFQQQHTTATDSNSYCNSCAKLEHIRKHFWSLILPRLRLFQRAIPGTFSRSFRRTSFGPISENELKLYLGIDLRNWSWARSWDWSSKHEYAFSGSYFNPWIASEYRGIEKQSRWQNNRFLSLLAFHNQSLFLREANHNSDSQHH